MSLFDELKRRNVIRVGLAYVVAGWLLAQVVELATDAFEAPPWVLKLIVTLIVIGLVPLLMFSWAYELTPEGIRREVEVDRDESITTQTGRKLNVLVIVLVLLALGVFAYDRFAPGTARSPVAPAVRSAQAVNADPSVAVLPFVNMSGNPENEYFSDGLTETLLHMLAQVDGLKVAARTSAFAFKGKNADVREIAATLDVGTILEGSVQRVGNRVRITAQLIDARHGGHLWSQNFDRTLDDIFAIQDEIANAVAGALRTSLLGEAGAGAAAAPVASVGTDSTRAYDLYLRGLEQYNVKTYTALPEAERLFKDALLEDAGFDDARLGLVRTYLAMQNTGLLAPPEAANRARAILGPLLERPYASPVVEAYDALLGLLAASFQYDAERSRALEAALLRAVALAPNEVELYGMASRAIAFYGPDGREDEALALVDRGLALDPLSANLVFTRAVILRDAERYDEALAALARMREIAPDNPSGYSGAAFVYESRGQWADVVRAYADTMRIDRQDHELAAGAAQALLQMGLVEEAGPWVRRAQLLNAEGDDTRRVAMQYLAHSGREDEALALAETVIREKRQNRRGVYFQAVGLYTVLMHEHGRGDEARAFLEATAPGMLAPDFSGAEQWWQRDIAGIGGTMLAADEDPLTRRTRAESMLAMFDELDIDLDTTPGGAIVALWQGDEATARKRLVAHLEDPSKLWWNWELLVVRNPALAPLLDDAEVAAALDRVRAAHAAEAARYRQMVASGEIAVP